MNQAKAPNPHYQKASISVFAHAELDASNRHRVFKGLASMVLDIAAS
jgi:hypothetical protein